MNQQHKQNRCREVKKKWKMQFVKLYFNSKKKLQVNNEIRQKIR